MKNKELWAQYQYYTQDVTQHMRKLGFAAGALCWFFKSSEDTFPSLILVALGLLVAYFLSDVMQGLLGALFLRCWTRHREKEIFDKTGEIEGEYPKPAWLDYPAWISFWVKLVCLLACFACIGLHLFASASRGHSA